MKISITLVIDVDPDEWVTVYGCPRADVRDDVKQYVLNSTQGLAGIEESGATVHLR